MELKATTFYTTPIPATDHLRPSKLLGITSASHPHNQVRAGEHHDGFVQNFRLLVEVVEEAHLHPPPYLQPPNLTFGRLLIIS